MDKYSLDQFLIDCKSLGWYEGKASPEWMGNLDIELREEDLGKVLMYGKIKTIFLSIMVYYISNDYEGISFNISYMTRTRNEGVVTNKEDLIAFMKAAGYNKGFYSQKIF